MLVTCEVRDAFAHGVTVTEEGVKNVLNKNALQLTVCHDDEGRKGG